MSEPQRFYCLLYEGADPAVRIHFPSHYFTHTSNIFSTPHFFPYVCLFEIATRYNLKPTLVLEENFLAAQLIFRLQSSFHTPVQFVR